MRPIAGIIALPVMLSSAAAGTQAQERPDRAGALEWAGWTESGVRPRGPTIRFSLRQDAHITIVRVVEGNPWVLVLTASYTAGDHSERVTNRAASGMTHTARSYEETCRMNPSWCSGPTIGTPSTRTRAAQTPSAGRLPEYYLVMASDSGLTEQEAQVRLRVAGVAVPDSALTRLPRLLVGDRTTVWAGVLVRQ